jgi:dihydrofolate synthase / folylpolyglutamate synthase
LDNYRNFLEHLFNARAGGIMLGLERMERCLAGLGHPERAFVARVHIGGTNGKGSAAAFVESMVRAAGHRTGRFTSPHLLRYCERICIDGEPVSAEAIMAATRTVTRAGGDQMSFFEHTTAIALWLFAEAGVHTAVLEVGLGGRLDATNAVPAEVAAVTGVAMDHEGLLGATLDAIAVEKAGIFKPGQRAVIGRSGEPEAVPVLVARARDAGVAALTVVDRPVPADWRLGMAGAHQRDNAATALAVMDHLDALGLVVTTEAQRREGLAQARMPGRLETVAGGSGRGPRVIVDGAHNPHAARMLAGFMDGLSEPPVLVLGVSRDKDVAGIVGWLATRAAAVVVTRARNERSMPTGELAALVAAAAPEVFLQEAANVGESLARASTLAGSDSVVLVAGSLFLAGEVRQELLGEPADELWVSDPAHVVRT